MSRIAPKSAVDLNTFRHVAILTFVAALVLALLVNGETRQAFEDELAEKSEQKRLEKAEIELARKGKGGNTTLVFKDKRSNKTSWSSDYDTGGVQDVPVDGEGAPELVAASSPRYFDAGGGVGQPAAVAPPGMSSAAMEQLKNKKKKPRPRDGLTRRPPPAEGEGEDY